MTNPDTIDLQLVDEGIVDEFAYDKPTGRLVATWRLVATCEDRHAEMTFSKNLVAAFPELMKLFTERLCERVRPPLSVEQRREIGTFDKDAYIDSLKTELAEFKQWASDACELLHEILPKHTAMRRDIDNRMIDLLRRMENP